MREAQKGDAYQSHPVAALAGDLLRGVSVDGANLGCRMQQYCRSPRDGWCANGGRLRKAARALVAALACRVRNSVDTEVFIVEFCGGICDLEFVVETCVWSGSSS